MSDYTIEPIEIGWIICAGGEPLLLVNDEDLAHLIVRDAEALLRDGSGSHSALSAVLNVTVKSPSMQSDAGDPPAMARSTPE